MTFYVDMLGLGWYEFSSTSEAVGNLMQGVYLGYGQSAHLLAGDDVTLGMSPAIGIINFGTIDTGDGNDQVIGIGNYAGIVNEGVISTGLNNDTIRGNGDVYGIINGTRGTINTGGGGDTIKGTGSDAGILNLGTIKTGAGRDNIIGVGNIGIINNGFINTNDGADTITGVYTGLGMARVMPVGEEWPEASYNYGPMGYWLPAQPGIISMSTFGAKESYTPTAYSGSIINNGIINTGKGDDIVDGITGGFGGYGVMNLGEDNDTLKGFGTGTFNGGAGDSDKILLGDGDYTITMEGEVTTITSNGVAMITTGFESISGSGGGEGFMVPMMSNSPTTSWFVVMDGWMQIQG